MQRRLLISAGIIAIGLTSIPLLRYYSTRDMRGIGTTHGTLDDLGPAMDAYLTDHGRYPAAKSIDDLRKAIVPRYLARFPAKDGRGRPWHLVVDPQNYVIWSLGVDDKHDGPWFRTQDMAMNPAVDEIVHNSTFVMCSYGVGAGRTYVKGPLEWSWNGNPAVTGLIDFTGWHYGKLQLRSGDRVVIEDSSQFEVPGGSYTLRAVLSSGQTYDVPGSFVVPRRGYVKRDVVIPAGWVEFTFRPPTRSAPCEIWSGQQHIVTLPMRRGEKVFPWFGAELLAGTYRATIRTANGITERAFTVRTGQDEKITIDLP